MTGSAQNDTDTIEGRRHGNVQVECAVESFRRHGSWTWRRRQTCIRCFQPPSRPHAAPAASSIAARATSIVDVLHATYPDHAILAEEGTAKGANADAEYLWIIDPLDGTTNFLHGFPQYCVSIALQHKGQITQGVIYDPVRNDLFTATRGRGAFLNDHRMRVSRRQHLRDCLIGTGFPFRDGSDVDTYIRMMRAMMMETVGLRRPGSAALDLAYVAAGYYDGFWEIGLNAWDVAAGSLLILEAGGLVGDLLGDNAYLYGGQVIAANPKIFAQIIKVLAPYQRAFAVPRVEKNRIVAG